MVFNFWYFINDLYFFGCIIINLWLLQNNFCLVFVTFFYYWIYANQLKTRINLARLFLIDLALLNCELLYCLYLILILCFSVELFYALFLYKNNYYKYTYKYLPVFLCMQLRFNCKYFLRKHSLLNLFLKIFLKHQSILKYFICKHFLILESVLFPLP